MYSTISLKEYRILNPHTDTVPTLTQMGLIGDILGRAQLRWVRKERRRAARQQFLKALTRPFIRLWNKIAGFNAPATAQAPPLLNLHQS